MTRYVIQRILVPGLLLTTMGCSAFIPVPVREQTKTHANVSDRVLQLWERLTPAQRRTAYEKSRRGWHVQNFNINGIELPDDLKKQYGFYELMQQTEEANRMHVERGR